MGPTERFDALMLGDEGEVGLDEAALLVAAHAYPELDLATELGRFDELAAACPDASLDGLCEALFDELGFVGNASDYYNPRNSYLNDVIERRTGIPISLAVVLVEVGRRVGVPLVPVGMPGHFLVRHRDDDELFVDPFGGGARLDPEGCEEVFRQLQGADAPFDPAFLEPIGTFVVLARVLTNLKLIFAQTGDRVSMAWVLRLLTRVPGVPGAERLELARVLASLARFGDAADELEAVAVRVGGADAERLVNAAAELRGRLN